MTPPRIVSLLCSATEIVCALGLENSLLAVSHECDFPPSIAGKPRGTVSLVDSSRPSEEIDRQVKHRLISGLPLYGLDEHLLRSLVPDLIVTQAQCDVCAIRYDDVMKLVASMPELSHTKVLTLSPATLADILQDVLRIGEAAGVPFQANQFASSLQQRIDRISSAALSLDGTSRPRVVCIEWTSPLMAAGNWTPELIELAGGRSGLATAGEHSRYVSWQQIVEFNPQVLLVAPCGFDLRRSQREAKNLPLLPDWQSLAAVQADQVFVLDGNALLNRSGPRIVDSLELLAHLLHPSLIPNPAGYWSEGIAWSRLSSR
jgi:iron complex transport system substrate-binding protein